MNNRVTTEEVADQFAKAIKLLLDWYRQEIVGPSQIRSDRSPVEKQRDTTPSTARKRQIAQAR